MNVDTPVRECLAWKMVEVGSAQRRPRFELESVAIPPLTSEDALVEIAGCGVCGSDVGFAYRGIKTRFGPPITLGHEICGRVVAGNPELIDKEVIVPTVFPCWSCDLCARRLYNRCLRQKMPGNSMGTWGGFASHIVVPSRGLCTIGARGGTPLTNLAIVADAVSTPYQAARRAQVGKGERIIIIGATGGCGFYLTQWVKQMGAAVVVAVGRNGEKLSRLSSVGADILIDVSGKVPAEVKQEFWSSCRKRGVDAKSGWKVFEISGTQAGQELALELLGHSGVLTIVGYSNVQVSYDVSRLSPLEAELRGSWGCTPEAYPFILDQVLSGVISGVERVQRRAMSEIADVFDSFQTQGSPAERIVLIPDFA